MNEFNDADQEIQTVTDSGRPVENRISKPKQAYAIYKQMLHDSEGLAFMRAQLKSQIDGAAPYDQSERERMGFSWQSNINSGSSASSIDLTVGSIWDMFTGVEHLAEFWTEEHDPQAPYRDYGNIIEKNYDKMVRNWLDFDFNTQLAIREMVCYAVGPMFFRDPYTWQFNSVKSANLLVPDNTKSSIGQLDMACIRDEFSPHEFFQMIEDEEVAKEAGWDISACHKLLINIYKKGQKQEKDEKYLSSSWESLLEKVRTRDVSLDTEFDKIRVVQQFVKESDGKVTQIIIREDEEPEDFLFYNDRRFDCISSAIRLMLFSIGDGYMKSIKSLAHKLYPINDVSDRILNHTLDGAILSSGLVLQLTNGDAGEAMMELTHGGGVTVIPSGVQAVQSTFAPPLQNLIQVRQLLKNIQNANIGVFDASSDESSNQEMTATEAQIRSQYTARFENNQAAWYYRQWDELLKEVFTRAISSDYPEWADGYEEAKEFRQKCLDQGVPPHLMEADKWEIRAARSIGYGSPANKMSITNDLIQIVSMLDESGRNAVIEEYIGARVPWTNKAKFVGIDNRDKIPALATHISISEDNDMIQGQQAVVSADDPHYLHIIQHIQRMSQEMQAFQEQPDPQKAMMLVQYFQLAVQHSSEHLWYLKRDESRSGQIKDIEAVLKKIVEFIKELVGMVQQLQEQQQAQAEEQQKMLAEAEEITKNKEVEVEKYKIDKMAEVEQYKAQLLDRARQAKTQTSTQASQIKTQNSIQNENIKTQSKLTNDRLLTLAEVQKKGLK